MGLKKKQRQINFFSIVGALLFLIAAVQCIVPFLYYGYHTLLRIGDSINYLSRSYWDVFVRNLPDLLSVTLECLSVAFLSFVLLLVMISLLRGRKGKLLRACAILLVVQSVSVVFLRIALDLLQLFLFDVPFSNEVFSIWQALAWIPAACLSLFIVSACGQSAGTRRLWPWLVFFIPSFAYAAFHVFGFLPINEIITNCDWDFSIYFTEGPSLRYTLPWFILKINEFLQIHTLTLAYFVLGLWIACPKKQKKVPVAQTVESTYVNEDGSRDFAAIADELYRYKGLLDSGAITQEEYDNIRKRLMG